MKAPDRTSNQPKTPEAKTRFKRGLIKTARVLGGVAAVGIPFGSATDAARAPHPAPIHGEANPGATDVIKPDSPKVQADMENAAGRILTAMRKGNVLEDADGRKVVERTSSDGTVYRFGVNQAEKPNQEPADDVHAMSLTTHNPNKPEGDTVLGAAEAYAAGTGAWVITQQHPAAGEGHIVPAGDNPTAEDQWIRAINEKLDALDAADQNRS